MVRAALLLVSALVAFTTASSKSLRGVSIAEPVRTLQEEDATEDGAAEPNLDVAVANFALNLEYLEAEFYSWAAFGEGLPECANNSVGGMKANLTAPMQAYAEEIAKHEIAHVRFLQAALGDAAVPCPALDIGPAFSAAADAAVGATLDPPYSPYYDDKWFALGAFIFEDVGVTAYNGAAPLITDKGILGAAAGILAVEAYHAGTIRTLLTIVKDELLTPYPLTVAQGVQAVSDLRALVGGGKDAGIVSNSTMSGMPEDVDAGEVEDDEAEMMPMHTGNATQIVPVDENAIAFARSTDEILAIVYLGGERMGGFYPMGLNGEIA